MIKIVSVSIILSIILIILNPLAYVIITLGFETSTDKEWLYLVIYAIDIIFTTWLNLKLTKKFDDRSRMVLAIGNVLIFVLVRYLTPIIVLFIYHMLIPGPLFPSV